MLRKHLDVLAVFSIVGLLMMAASREWSVIFVSLTILEIGILFGVIVGLLSKQDGSPLNNIEAGRYDIVFMNVAEENLSVVLRAFVELESKGKENGELFYRFPLKAFNGEILPEAKVLEVVVSGNRGQFKKLHLIKEYSNNQDQGNKGPVSIETVNVVGMR